MTSLPVWAIVVAGIAQCFGSFTLITEIPAYMDGIMNYDINAVIFLNSSSDSNLILIIFRTVNYQHFHTLSNFS